MYSEANVMVEDIDWELITFLPNCQFSTPPIKKMIVSESNKCNSVRLEFVVTNYCASLKLMFCEVVKLRSLQ